SRVFHPQNFTVRSSGKHKLLAFQTLTKITKRWTDNISMPKESTELNISLDTQEAQLPPSNIPMVLARIRSFAPQMITRLQLAADPTDFHPGDVLFSWGC